MVTPSEAEAEHAWVDSSRGPDFLSHTVPLVSLLDLDSIQFYSSFSCVCLQYLNYGLKCEQFQEKLRSYIE